MWHYTLVHASACPESRSIVSLELGGMWKKATWLAWWEDIGLVETSAACYAPI